MREEKVGRVEYPETMVILHTGLDDERMLYVAGGNSKVMLPLRGQTNVTMLNVALKLAAILGTTLIKTRDIVTTIREDSIEDLQRIAKELEVQKRLDEREQRIKNGNKTTNSDTDIRNN